MGIKKVAEFSLLTKCNKVFLVVIIAFLSGCVSGPGTSTREVHFQDTPGVDTLLVPAEYREVYFSSSLSGDRHCRSPGPDFTVQASEGTSIGAALPSIPGAEDTVGISSGQSALTLGGRSAEVLLARELMYRACELSININANEQQSTDIYYHFLNAIVELSKMQTEVGTSSATDSTSSSVKSDDSKSDKTKE